MSDFDKEAEREKLRKKYADDEESRADTKRMSELLLKGATMTNQHCDACSDPLFRHNGQIFCPTCQANGQEPDAAQQSPASTAQSSPSPSAPTAETSPEHSQSETPPSAPSQPPSQPTSETSDTVTNGQSSASADAADPTPTDIAADSTPADIAAESPAGPSPTQPPNPSESSAEGLTAARQSLIGTVTRFSQRAAATDDPRRAKELLSAAREAAETLRAVEQ